MKNKKGFTLVELLAVIAILAILVIISMPNILKRFNEAKKSAFLDEVQITYDEVTSSKIINEMMGGTKKNVYSSTTNDLNLSGGDDLEYCIITDNSGNIEKMKISNGSYYTYYDGSKDINNYNTTDIYEKNEEYSIDCENYAYDYLTSKGVVTPKNCIVETSSISDNILYYGSYKYTKGTDKVGIWRESGSYWTMDFTTKSIDGWRVEFADSRITEVNKDNVPCSSINGENVVSTSFMFTQATSLTKIDLSNFYTANITNMQGMFFNAGYDSKSLEIDLSNFDTSNVTDMSYMFKATGFDVTNNFKILGLYNFNTSKVTTMKQMFESFGGQNYKKDFNYIDLSKWDVRNVTTMERMFAATAYNAPYFSLGNISGWNTSNVTNMNGMFVNAGLNANYHLDLSKWNVSNVSEHNYFNDSVTTKVISPKWK